MKSIAAGMLSGADGSSVPAQSNSSRKRVRSVRVELAPCETTSGWMSRLAVARGPGGSAMPLGAHSHLWALPVLVRRAEGVEVDGHHARRVRAVDERVDPAAVQLADESLDRAARAPSGW